MVSLPLLALMLLAPPSEVGPTGCTGADSSPRLRPFSAEQRIAFLRTRLEAERGPARAWSWTFGSVNGALTVGQLAGAVVVRSGPERAILLAGAGTSALGVGQIVLAPIGPAEADLAPGDGSCAELVRLEGALSRGARNQRLGTGLAAQLGNLAINAAFGVASGLLAHRAGPGLLTFALGWGLGEAQILTEPTGLVRARDRYRAGELDAPSAVEGSPGPRWAVRPAGAGLVLSVAF